MSSQTPARHVRRSTHVLEPATSAAITEALPAKESAGPLQPIEPQAVSPLENLWHIARDALQIDPPLWISSIFGLPWTWRPPFQRYSEFRGIDLWRPLRSVS